MHLPYPLIESPNGDVKMRIRDRSYSPEEISAIILQELRYGNQKRLLFKNVFLLWNLKNRELSAMMVTTQRSSRKGESVNGHRHHRRLEQGFPIPSEMWRNSREGGEGRL